MKKVNLIFILFSLLALQTMQANQPERKVLYTLGKNETLHYSEYTASLKFDGQKFACIIEDTVRKELSFIYNGEKKITADHFIDCLYLSFDGFDKCVIYYGNHRIKGKPGEGQYYKAEDKLYGPYEKMLFLMYPSGYFDPTWHELHHFDFERMGNRFTHKSDGSITVKELAPSPYYVVGEGSSGYVADEEEPVFLSPNEKHTAHFSLSEIHKVYVDDVLYVIPSTSESKYFGCCVFDDGSCLYYDRSVSQYNEFRISVINGDCDAFYLSKGNIKKLSSTEVFNFKTQTIVRTTDAIENANWFQYLGYPCWSSRWDYESIKGGNYTILDKEEKHYFISNVEYNYVMVDDYRFGKECALSAWYDPDDHAFIWIAWEGNELASYRYKL